ncbi:MAG: hypothetical protein JRG79_15535 [Deltaproteobacteria bacterium]|nr:hypothetical protein [Deltaproteobacteria bacterium]
MGLLIVAGFMVAACTTDQLVKKEKKPKGPLTAEERSRRETENRVIESSWYESSDYHTQQDGEGGVDVGEWMRTRKEMKAEQEETEKRLAKLEKKAGKQQAAEAQVQGVGSESTAAVAASVVAANKGAKSQRGLRFKVALVLMPETYRTSTEVKTALVDGVSKQFAGHRWFLLVEPEEAEEILAHQGLAVSQKNKAKIARTLGVYPAARLVLFLDKVALDRKGNKMQGRLDYTLVDGFSGRTISRDQRIVSAAQGAAEKGELLRVLLAQAVVDLEKRAAAYGWSTRVAMVESNHIYLSAGKASGLKQGDMFAIYGPGKEIIHPIAKVSMGFQRGPYKGMVKVLNLFGRDASEATVVAGPGTIEVNDIVTLPEEQE